MPNSYLAMLRGCCNNKIMHLLRAVDPEIMHKPADQFDSIILANFADYFKLRLACQKRIADISPVQVLDYPAMAGMAEYQIREHSDTGGLDLKSMAELAVPAFYAATLRHLRTTLPELPPGHAILNAGLSSQQLFSQSFIHAHTVLITRGATQA